MQAMGEQNAVRKARPSVRCVSRAFIPKLPLIAVGMTCTHQVTGPALLLQPYVGCCMPLSGFYKVCLSGCFGCVCRRDTAALTSAKYREMFGEPDDSVPATFQVLGFSIQSLPTVTFKSPLVHAPTGRLPGSDTLRGCRLRWLVRWDALHVQVIYLTGWAPHSSQQRAARRGSASASFQVRDHACGAAVTQASIRLF